LHRKKISGVINYAYWFVPKSTKSRINFFDEALMGYAEIIANEVQNLPAKSQAEVLSFVAALKAQGDASLLPTLSPDQIVRRDAMMKALSAFSADMTGFVFDRDEANARR
jgi:hypothetical protein